MITVISTPKYSIQVSPAIDSRWLATESPNLFRLKREDVAITGAADVGGFLFLTLADTFVGNLGDRVSVWTTNNQAMNTGLVTAVDGTDITTDIPYVTGMTPIFLNNNTLRDGYYFEGRLTINGVVQPITVIASPDTKGIADLDVSGILRIMVQPGKSGDYTEPVMKEPLKSGKFTLEYRECWYGSDEDYTAEGNDWFYAEAVRSEEQGSNLHEYVTADGIEAKFLNSFERPVYFVGLPFDISFILLESAETSIQVTTRKYNPANTLLGTDSQTIDTTNLKGFLNSLRIDPASIEEGASYMTVEIGPAVS